MEGGDALALTWNRIILSDLTRSNTHTLWLFELLFPGPSQRSIGFLCGGNLLSVCYPSPTSRSPFSPSLLPKKINSRWVNETPRITATGYPKFLSAQLFYCQLIRRKKTPLRYGGKTTSAPTASPWGCFFFFVVGISWVWFLDEEVVMTCVCVVFPLLPSPSRKVIKGGGGEEEATHRIEKAREVKNSRPADAVRLLVKSEGLLVKPIPPEEKGEGEGERRKKYTRNPTHTH